MENELIKQRKEIERLREEINGIRKELSVSTAINLVYKQLERFDRIVQDLKISSSGIIYTGYFAIEFLWNQKEYFFHNDNQTAEENLERKKIYINQESQTYFQNEAELQKFSKSVSNNAEALKIVLSELDAKEINQLKAIYFENIGSSILDVAENILELAAERKKIFETADYARFAVDVAGMPITERALGSFIEFRDNYH